ncbi:MAG: ATP-binding protein [Ignavibacteriaceae bacterium]|nr:ATP-binding protein [Ignavibacteriaceae bacterium]
MKKELPVSSSNYESLILSNGYYADKTPYIPVLEKNENQNIFLLRPRRFGKSLFLSTLEAYYGVQYSDKFAVLFGETAAGKNPTATRNSYHILKFDFSGIVTHSADDILDSFNSRIHNGLREFTSNYGFMEKEELETVLSSKYAGTILSEFISRIQLNGFRGKVFLLIDEYDHFANELFSFDRAHFRDIVSGNGWVRKFYETVKYFIGAGIITRFFATGVTPVTLDSMTSGFNIARNISLEPQFSNICGFSEAEIRNMISLTVPDELSVTADNLIPDLRAWYNGSSFTFNRDEKIYNPRLIIHFLTAFYSEGTYPREMTDINVTSDYSKIGNIFRTLPPESARFILEEIITKEEIDAGLTLQFNPDLTYGITEAVSLLYYNGLLTIKNEKLDLVRYVIPNNVIRQIYRSYLRDTLEKTGNLLIDMTETGHIFSEMAYNGNTAPLISLIEKITGALSDRDFMNYRESNLKMIILSIFAKSNAWFVFSEFACGNGYADLWFERTEFNDGMFEYLIELKYIRKEDEAKYEFVKEEGIAQLKRYLSSDYLKHRKNVIPILLLQHNKSTVDSVRL